ncbi:MAG TPA: DNA (cytosine-5-)-methyltransferase [Pirellulales bacterium]|nr:DNA (cytosine-5-)-methyltransferase [Pirellulales bacterium]
MKTVELFSGIGGFRVAADARRIATVWANDICAKACSVYRHRFGADVLHEGNIAQFARAIPPHDLLTGGFPCQPFSSAGKKRGINDSRGTLFQFIVDILHEHHPKFFILENVKRLLTMESGLHFATILSSLAELDYTIEWRLLNAMHLGLPQNRQRVFIVGVAGREFELGDRRSVVSTRLAGAHDLAALRGHDLEDLADPSCWQPIEQHGRCFSNWGVAADGRFFARDLPQFSESTPFVPVSSVLEQDVSSEFDFTETTLRWIGKNTPVNRLVQGVEILSNQAGGARMGYTIFGVNGVAPTLTSTASRHYERYQVGDRYRRLTNVEYARIQGFADSHCSTVSVYDQYALIGNAVPPPMAGWVMDRLTAAISRKSLPRSRRQKALF